MESLTAFVVSLLMGFTPMIINAFIIYCLDRYEKEPLKLLGAVFIWGAVVAAAGAFLVNTLFGVGVEWLTHSEKLADISTGIMSAPLLEETLKGLAVLFVFWAFHNEFDSVLDGIVYAAVTALGFAATENTFYIFSEGFLHGGWSQLWTMSVLRSFVVGWQHPFFTSFFGIGLAYARLTSNPIRKWTMPILGWFAAILTHSFHNIIAMFGSGVVCLLGSVIDWSGWLAMLVFIIILGRREKNLLRHYLLEEVDLGNITTVQYETALSTWRRIRALLRENIHHHICFYQLCAEISHKKYQFENFGDETGNSIIIGNLRDTLKAYSVILTG